MALDTGNINVINAILKNKYWFAVTQIIIFEVDRIFFQFANNNMNAIAKKIHLNQICDNILGLVLMGGLGNSKLKGYTDRRLVSFPANSVKHCLKVQIDDDEMEQPNTLPKGALMVEV